MDIAGAEALAARIAQQEQWREALAVRTARQPAVDPDGHALESIRAGVRIYRAERRLEAVRGPNVDGHAPPPEVPRGRLLGRRVGRRERRIRRLRAAGPVLTLDRPGNVWNVPASGVGSRISSLLPQATRSSEASAAGSPSRRSGVRRSRYAPAASRRSTPTDTRSRASALEPGSTGRGGGSRRTRAERRWSRAASGSSSWTARGMPSGSSRTPNPCAVASRSTPGFGAGSGSGGPGSARRAGARLCTRKCSQPVAQARVARAKTLENRGRRSGRVRCQAPPLSVGATPTRSRIPPRQCAATVPLREIVTGPGFEVPTIQTAKR